MTPKLYYVRESPPARAVLMCAKALGLKLELVLVDFFEGEHLKDDYMKKNPQHTIPLLEDDDGFIIPDSHAIMGYLVAKYGKDDWLYSKSDYKRRAIIDHRLHFDTGVLFARGAAMASPLFITGARPTQDKRDALREAYTFLNQILGNSKTDYVAGNNLTIADFSIISSLTSSEIFEPYTAFPHIKAYMERIQKFPFYEANKEGLALLRSRVESRLRK